MVNIASFIGTGGFGEDIFYKLPWMRHLDKKHHIYIVLRIKPDVHLGELTRRVIGDSKLHDLKNSMDDLLNVADELCVIHDSPYLNKQYTTDEINDVQKWLNISFGYISSLSRTFYNRDTMIDARDEKSQNNYLAGVIQFFRDFFIERDISVFINTIEDTTISTAAYYTARKLGISVLGFGLSRFPKKGVMFCSDFSDVCIWNEKDVSWDDVERLYRKSTIVGAEMLTASINYWKLSSLPQRLKGIQAIVNLRRCSEHIINIYDNEKLIFPKMSILSASRIYLIALIRTFLIKTISRKPDYSESYFLFPLHYMDDAQITFREPFIDQFKLIFNISKTLPIGYYLYVKPHPHYLGSDVSFKKLLRLSKLKNIRIIEPSILPTDLILNSKGVMTINSTTGFEALMMGVPVVTFGHDFYCKNHLCCVVRDINELPERLMDIINANNQSDRNEVMNFVKTVYANTIWIDGNDFGFFGLTDEDGQKIASALNTILEKLDMKSIQPSSRFNYPDDRGIQED